MNIIIHESKKTQNTLRRLLKFLNDEEKRKRGKETKVI